jgi:predicted DNA-binding ribbon-helix-helix protein
MVGEHRADYGSEWEAMSSLGADEKVRIRALEREVKEPAGRTKSSARRLHILRWLSSTATRDCPSSEHSAQLTA